MQYTRRYTVIYPNNESKNSATGNSTCEEDLCLLASRKNVLTSESPVFPTTSSLW